MITTTSQMLTHSVVDVKTSSSDLTIGLAQMCSLIQLMANYTTFYKTDCVY